VCASLVGVTFNWNVVQAPFPTKISRVDPGLPVPLPPLIVTVTLLPLVVASTPAPTKSILVTVFVNIVPSFLTATFAAPPPPDAEKIAIFALPSPESVIVIVTFAVLTKFNCLPKRVDPLFCETLTVLAAALTLAKRLCPPTFIEVTLDKFLDESRTIVFATSSPFLTLNVLFVVFPDI